MKTFLICLFFLIINGQLLHLKDEEFLSDIKFINKSYAEFRILSTDKSMNIWLKPYLSDETISEKIFDENCVLNGQIVIGKEIIGTAILSVCGQRITGIFDLNGIQYSLNSENMMNSNEVWRRKRYLAPDILSRIRHDPSDSAICANTLPDIDKAVVRAMNYEMGQDNPDIHFGKAIIKVGVFIDQMLFWHRFDGDLTEAKQFVAIHIAYLQKQLQQKNILRNIDIELVVNHFSIAPFYETHKWDMFTYNRKFCRWVSKSEYYSDINILLSGSIQWWIVDGELSTKIQGLAAVGQLCNRWHSCLIIEAREGFKSVRVLVHEIGHNLGAQHDGKEEFNTTECDPDAFIMSWAVGHGKNTWSSCSAKLMRLFLLSMKRDKSNQIECLKEKPELMDSLLNVKLAKYKNPGLTLTPDDQCRMTFGSKFTYDYEEIDNICMRMRCKDDFFTTTTWGALEGTECGKNRKCDTDRCRRIPLGLFNNYVKLGMASLRNMYV